MSESSVNGPTYESAGKPSPDAKLISIESLQSGFSPESDSFVNISETEKLLPESRSLLDTNMSELEIAAVAGTWNPSKVFRGKQNSERPRQVIQWMLEQTNITADVSEEKALTEALTERDRRMSRGMTVTRIQRNLGELTPRQTRMLELANRNNTKVAAAQRKIDDFSSKGLSKLLDMITELEVEVMEKCAKANIVRLFNAVDDKTGGNDRDLIIAKRTLVAMLSNELPGETSQL